MMCAAGLCRFGVAGDWQSPELFPNGRAVTDTTQFQGSPGFRSLLSHAGIAAAVTDHAATCQCHCDGAAEIGPQAQAP
eukprot:3397006-Rhodomonas_salina.2